MGESENPIGEHKPDEVTGSIGMSDYYQPRGFFFFFFFTLQNIQYQELSCAQYNRHNLILDLIAVPETQIS